MQWKWWLIPRDRKITNYYEILFSFHPKTQSKHILSTNLFFDILCIFNFDTIVLHQVYWNSNEELYFINKYDVARKIYPISGRLLAILMNIFITPDEVRTNACIPLSNWTITPFVVLAIVCPPFLSIVAGSISGNLEMQLELIF